MGYSGAIFVLVAVTAAHCLEGGGPPPAKWDDAGSVLGVNTHNAFPMPELELDLLQAAGIRWIRTDVSWASIEQTKGEYNYSQFDLFFEQLASRNIGWICILGDANPLYGAPNGIGKLGANATAAQIDGFARFAKDIGQNYGSAGVAIYFELTNEPNTGGGYGDPLRYANLILPAGIALRSVNASVAIGSVADVDPHPDPENPPPHPRPYPGSGFTWLESVLKHAGGTVADMVTVHPYRLASPETFMPDAAQLNNLISQYSPIERRPRLAQGEWGYSYWPCSASAQKCGSQGTRISAETEGKLMVRMYLTAIAAGAKPAIWYDWKSSPTALTCGSCEAPGGSRPPCCGEHMGMIDANARPLPSWHGVRTLSRMVSGTRFQGKLDTCGATPCPEMSGDWALGFTNETHTVVTVWSFGLSPHVLELHFAFGTWSQIDWLGNSLGAVSSPPNGGHVSLQINATCGDIYEDVDTVEQCAPLYLVQRRNVSSVGTG